MNPVEFEECEVVAETDLAICVEGVLEDGMWVPKSEKILSTDSECLKKGDTGTLVVSEWWANQKGLL